MTTLKGCMLIFFVLMVVAVLVFAGCASIAGSFADWRQSANMVKAVEITETQATERTRILADAAVEIAKIQADTTKKTNLAFVVFWLVRALTWMLTAAAGLVWVLVAVKAVKQWTLTN